MFTLEEKSFMANNMKFDVDFIESTINELFFTHYKNAAINEISKYIKEMIRLENLGLDKKTTFPYESDIYKFIEDSFCRIIRDMKIINGSEIHDVFDGLQHSFKVYATGGLHSLFIYQAKESWYPKIKLTSILIPNDINKLPPAFTIYRGCDSSELANSNFGQSWSLSSTVAKEFAFTHYAQQSWYKRENRVVLVTNFSKEDIFFYSNSYGEDEVVIDIKKLKNVNLHK